MHTLGGSVRRVAALPAASCLTAAALVTACLVTACLVAVPTAVSVAQPAATDATLDVGPYPTVPAAPLGAAGSPHAGAAAEGRRMADFVVGPWEFDPALIGEYENSAVVIDGPETARGEFPVEVADVLAGHQLIDGFGTARWSDDIEFQHTVLRFADPDVAAAAARDLAHAIAHRPVPAGPTVPGSIPGHPQTAAFEVPLAEDGRTATYVRAITAHGPYVLSERVTSAAGVDAAATMIATVLDRQLPLIDRFPLTPPPLLAGLPVDPSGLMARTLPLPSDQITASRPGSYGTHGTLHFQSNPVRSAKIFAETAMSNAAYGSTGVYETRDAQAAQQLSQELIAQHLVYGTEAGAVEGIPASRCTDMIDPDNGRYSSYCVATFDRYLAEAQADTLLDAQQRTAAQYVLLTR
ncbi:hypothetical protein ACNUDN_10470 [Mycobacterium sp. smrl_JER01]|uniref:DUF7373 family lipoprotein n=1 Tax=Mycobacterium sp. smrl_JER01 TaxID=3402633 RepID=UPI003AC208BE